MEINDRIRITGDYPFQQGKKIILTNLCCCPYYLPLGNLIYSINVVYIPLFDHFGLPDAGYLPSDILVCLQVGV